MNKGSVHESVTHEGNNLILNYLLERWRHHRPAVRHRPRCLGQGLDPGGGACPLQGTGRRGNEGELMGRHVLQFIILLGPTMAAMDKHGCANVFYLLWWKNNLNIDNAIHLVSAAEFIVIG